MIFALFAKLAGVFPIKWPEWLRTLAAWAVIVAAVVLLAWGLKTAYDASIIRDHEAGKTADAIEAYDDSASARAIDAVKNLRADDLRKAEIEKAVEAEQSKPPEKRATVTPQTKAFLCSALREDYTPRELDRMKVYQENCK